MFGRPNPEPGPAVGVAGLGAQVDTLRAENAALREENAGLRSALAEARDRIRRLEERLNQNSLNSSRPPSSDGPAVKRPPAGKKSKRQRGGQPGHQGKARALVEGAIEADPVECVPEMCEECGQVLTGTDPEPERHLVVEIPDPRPLLTTYLIHWLRCPSCGHVTGGRLPKGVTRSAFGPRLHALVALLTGRYLLAKREVASLLEDLFGIHMATGSVCRIERRMSAAIASATAAAGEHVRAAAVVHADETSWREAKSRAWLWVAATREVVVFLIQRRRDTEAAKNLLGALFAGVGCVDRWGAYTWLRWRQVCWAHLLRDFQAMAERYGSEWHGVRLVAAGQRVLGAWAEWHDGQIDRATMLARIAPERVRIQRLIEQGTRCSARKTRGVCKELLKVEREMWLFLERADVPPTNNLAERNLRRGVLWRKVSYGTDSEPGSRYVERILTTVLTLRAQQRDVFGYLVAAHNAHVAGDPAPSLLPVT
jgi:transposase